MKQTQCVTAAMLKDPQSAVPKGPASGSNDCKITDYKLAGNTATYKMTCTQPVPMSATGEMKYSGTDAYTGTLTIDMGGQNDGDEHRREADRRLREVGIAHYPPLTLHASFLDNRSAPASRTAWRTPRRGW